jgi:hypothetical protein
MTNNLPYFGKYTYRQYYRLTHLDNSMVAEVQTRKHEMIVRSSWQSLSPRNNMSASHIKMNPLTMLAVLGGKNESTGMLCAAMTSPYKVTVFLSNTAYVQVERGTSLNSLSWQYTLDAYSYSSLVGVFEHRGCYNVGSASFVAGLLDKVISAKLYNTFWTEENERLLNSFAAETSRYCRKHRSL